MQKKFLLLLTACFLTLLSNAQILKGTISPNFDIGDLNNISIKNGKDLKRNYLSFNPGVGYFIKNNWEIGAGINFTSFQYKYHGTAYNYDENSNTAGFRIYTNYYLGKGKLKPFLNFQTGWEYVGGDYSYSGTKYKINQNYIYTSIGAGLNWNIRKNISLFTEASYRRESPLNINGHSRFNLTVGVRFFLNNKNKH